MDDQKNGDIKPNFRWKDLCGILKSNFPIALNDLKSQSGLSNKKWDKAIKVLTKNNLAKVEKTENSMLVKLV